MPDVMPAAVFMGLEVAVEDRPTPARARRAAARGQPLRDLRLRPALPPRMGRARAGVIEGHEYTGTVVAVGDGVTGWAVGDRVVGGPSPAVRQVRVLPRGPPVALRRAGAGSAATTATGRARSPGYKTVAAAESLRVPDGLSLKHAALAEPLAVALHGITQGGGARPGTRWLVTGGGPIGFLSVAALKALGVDDIVVSEPKRTPPRAVREARRADASSPTSS